MLGYHIQAQAQDHIELRNCLYSDGYVAVQIDGSTAVIQDCTVLSGLLTHMVFIGSTIEMYNNRLSGGGRQVLVTNGALLQGEGNILSGSGLGGAGSATIEVHSASIDYHGNDICKDSNVEYVVKCGSNMDDIVDLSGNYWGSVSPGWHDQYIYDGNDSDSITTIVKYSPYSDESLPNEPMGWGDVKRLYR